MIKHTVLKGFSGLVLFSFVHSLNAAWYQVEVIIFENLSPQTDGEIWYENPGLPDRSNSIKLISELADEEQQSSEEQEPEESVLLKKKAELVPYLQLPEENLRLKGVERVLKLSREYRPLTHLAWQQPGLSSANARPVHLQQFEEPDTQTTEENADKEPDDIYALQNSADSLTNEYQVEEAIFEGTLRLRSSRFLHVDLDFAFFPDFLTQNDSVISDNDSGFIEQQADYVRLRESRKIKLNEINYFDHPVFGVLLRVSRLKQN